MKTNLRWKALAGFGALVLTSSLFAGSTSAKKEASEAAVVNFSDADSMRIEGEKRFHANCGRCHAAPQKFPPRMMGTVLRHMRVRATITEEDRRLILFYMTQ
jgi:mono/diheme cytochrome c family protein